jgi:hypothetical protein
VIALRPQTPKQIKTQWKKKWTRRNGQENVVVTSEKIELPLEL